MRCDASVGVIVCDGHRHLLVTRNTPSVGVAPVAGHIDDHGSPEQAARAEVIEETGLTVTSLSPVAPGWSDNRCRRHPGDGRVGHHWTIYTASVSGTLAPSPRETRAVRWYTRPELRALMERTIDLAEGRLPWPAFAQRPGLEPVWARWLAEAGILHPTDPQLQLLNDLAAHPARQARDATLHALDAARAALRQVHQNLIPADPDTRPTTSWPARRRRRAGRASSPTSPVPYPRTARLSPPPMPPRPVLWPAPPSTSTPTRPAPSTTAARRRPNVYRA